MKYLITTVIVAITATLGVLTLSCDDTSNPIISNQFPDPIDSLSTDIRLIVYSDGSGEALDTIQLTAEGEVVIDVPDPNPFYDPPRYHINAISGGFYTEIYKCSKGDTIDVDLDAIPQVANSVTGVILSNTPTGLGCYLADYQIAMTRIGGKSVTTTTDAQGRFGFSNLEEGDYLLHFSYQGIPFSFDLYNHADTDYKEFSFFEPIVVLAPNIYLYPESTSDIQVKVSFPDVGKILISEPAYNNGWNVSVTKDGIIDNKYTYLFYEALLPDPNNQEYGWLITRSDLEKEFRKILSDYGCIENEIDDFIEFWVPRLDYAPWFAVYPQDVESMITLDISPKPESLLRLLFFIRGVEREIKVIPPLTIEKLVRNRFTAVEWGAYELK